MGPDAKPKSSHLYGVPRDSLAENSAFVHLGHLMLTSTAGSWGSDSLLPLLRGSFWSGPRKVQMSSPVPDTSYVRKYLGTP
jgi:hypothetical protein